MNIDQLIENEIHQRLRDQLGALVLNDFRLNATIKVLTAQLLEKEAELEKLRAKEPAEVSKTNGAEHPIIVEDAQREL